MFKDELYTRVRARRDSDDDDIGLPHSPCTSPTTIDVLTQGLKEKSTKSQTTCSAGSLISMGSSENDDDSAAQLSSGHSSRMSLLERRSIDSEGDVDLSQSVPLNHNAAHHKIAVRPKRKYGLPQRRLKQLAASALSTLPSTPELIEDNGKSVSKLETVEVFESTTVSVKSSEVASSTNSQSEEFDFEKSESAVSYKIASSKHERQVFQVKQGSTAENSVLECKNEVLKCDTGEMSVIRHFSHLTSDVTNSSLSSEVHDHGEELLSKVSIKEKCDGVKKSNDALYVSCNTSVTNSILETSNVSESLNTSKDEFERCQEFVLKEKSSQKSDVTALRVSALIKNLEKSESSCVHDNANTVEKEQEAQILVSGAVDAAESKVCDKRALDSEFVLNSESLICKESHIEIESLKNNLHLITQKGTSPLSEISSKLNSTNTADKAVKEQLKNDNIISESVSNDTFVASSSKNTLLKSCSSDSEWQQMHQFHAVVTEKQSDFSVMSSISTEEESIMSEKNVSVPVSESRSKTEEGKIFVSHNKANGSLNQYLEGDKMNLGEHTTFSTPSFQAINTKRQTEDDDKKQFVSSIDICADTLKSPISEMTVHSLISQIASCKSNEDKVTISVNAEESKVTANETSQASFEQSDAQQKLYGTEIVFKSHSSAISSNSSSSCTNVELEGKTKSYPLDNTSVSKASRMQKRVSVEIVPFSQRVKERKYQPVIYSREEVSDTTKAKSNVVIERKLSDRKISSGQTTSQVKGNNRHSFSGVISEANKMENELKNRPQLSKDEKPSGPVHIRIHKDKSNVTTSSKSHAQKISSTGFSDKLQQLETPKQLKPHLMSQEKSDIRSKRSLETGANEASTKQWEVKIHPAAKLKAESSFTTQGKMETKKECVTFQDEQHSAHDKSEEVKQKSDEAFPSITNKKSPEDAENALNVMPQGNLKSGRENPSPTEMEPELFRVFARRSVKQRTFEKPSSKNTGEMKTPEVSSSDDSSDVVEKVEDNHRIINVSDNSTVIKISEQLEGCLEKSPDIVKKKSKSFSEKEKLEKQKTTTASSLQATSLNRRQMHSSVETTTPVQETVHRRQRLASVPDIPVILPPSPIDMTLTTTSQQNGTCKENDSPIANKGECLHRTSSLSIPSSGVIANGSSSSGVIDSLKVKENADILSKDSPTPQWLQLAQQRRELREQRERLLLGSSTNSFVLESSGKPSRSSKVWDMVNNFQKLQMT